MKLMIRAHDLGVKGEENIVKKLNELSLDGVQLVAYKSIDGVSYRPDGIEKETAARVGKALFDAGKEIALVGAYFNPVHPNEDKSRLGEEVFCDYLSKLELLGASVVGSETGSYMGDPWGFHPSNRTEEARDRVVSTFSRLADCAASYSACIGIEGAYNHVCYSPDVLNDVVGRIGRDNVKVIFDLYNYLDISNYTEAYKILECGHELFGERILLYHLKDFTVADGRLMQCGVGRGILDYRRILENINKYNPDATLVLEGTVGDDIAYAVKYLKDIINEIQNK